MNLTNVVTTLIKEQQALSFADFMRLALYHPIYGYYTGNLPKFGKSGDFITAPELTPLFGQALANQCQQIFSHLANPSILEFGAGSGRLCVDLLQHLQDINALPEHYFILEVSGHLKERQQLLFEAEIPQLLSKISWLSSWPGTAFEGVIIANEVLDAMPVHRFEKTIQGLNESFIELDPDGQLHEVFKPIYNPQLMNHIDRILPSTLPLPYRSEANLAISSWVQQCANTLSKGVILIMDYGFPRHEYYHPDRREGSIMCHYQHQSHPNPLLHIGEQDITAHIDFTEIAEAALAANLLVSGYTNQASFLLGNGLLDLLAREPSVSAHQAVKMLTHPSEMGELFKVIALTQHLDIDLNGFELFDKRMSL